MIARRTFLGSAATLVGVAALGRIARADPRVVEILMRSDPMGAKVGFDPLGIRVEPGTTIRWRVEANVHTATAYHPKNGKPLRIPAGAQPWDSGYMVEPGKTFEVVLTVEGVYDYFCRPHEQMGMVGRIIVGKGGPVPPDGDLPPAVRAAFPSVEKILKEGKVPLPSLG